MSRTALRALAIPEIDSVRPLLVPELPVWAAVGDDLVAGRADALAVRNGRVEIAIDWKSDVNPTPAVRTAYVRQLHKYLEATGATRGALVFMTIGEIVWVNRDQI